MCSDILKRQVRPKKANLWIILGLVVSVLVSIAPAIHALLAVTKPVDSNILVVEGWVPPYVLDASVNEFRKGGYKFLFTSGLDFDANSSPPNTGSVASQAASQILAEGFDPAQLIVCPTAFTHWNRTSNSAVAVRDELARRGIKPKGINIVTAGPHARETLIAYDHIMGKYIPIGVISIPVRTYNKNWWWASSQGNFWTLKNVVGAIKEILIGQRE